MKPLSPLQKEQVGPANALMEIETLEDWLGISRATVCRLLRSLKVPLFHVGRKSFYNLHTLERVLFYLNRLGGSGYAAPGSLFKTKNMHKSKAYEQPALEITEDDLRQMGEPIFLAEWMATGAKNSSQQNLLLTTLMRRRKTKKAVKRKKGPKQSEPKGVV